MNLFHMDMNSMPCHDQAESEDRGGVAVLHKSGLKLKKVSPRGHFTHFEQADYHVMIHGVTFRLCIIYRPPPPKWNGLVNTVFFDQ